MMTIEFAGFRPMPLAAVLAACLVLPAGSAVAQDLGQLAAQMGKATADAKAKAQSGQKTYSVQSTSSIDNDLNALVGAINGVVNCAGGKSAFNQQYGAQLSQIKQMLGHAQQLQSNPMMKAIAAAPLASILPTALPLIKSLASSCQNFSGGGSAAVAPKYEQVSKVMKQVFTGGDLGPNSRAVRHAADVDMPARGGTPDSLRAYLNSQGGTVKNWYKTNFGLK